MEVQLNTRLEINVSPEVRRLMRRAEAIPLADQLAPRTVAPEVLDLMRRAALEQPPFDPHNVQLGEVELPVW